MKRLFFIATCTSLFYIAQAQQDTMMNKKTPGALPKDGKYCAVLKDGKPMVMLDGRILTADVKLGDGSKLTTTGGIVKKDGSRIVMKNGDCVDKNGSLNEQTSVDPALKPGNSE